MTSDAGLDPAAVEIGTFLPRSPEQVWRALTEPALLERWLMPSVGFAATPGTHFLFTLPASSPGEIACEVLTVRAPEQLTLAWVDVRAPNPARWPLDLTVRPQGRGSRLLLTQTGFDIADRRQKMARNAMERGWRSGLSRLAELLDDVEP